MASSVQFSLTVARRVGGWLSAARPFWAHVYLLMMLFGVSGCNGQGQREPPPSIAPQVSTETVVVVGHRSLSVQDFARLYKRTHLGAAAFAERWAADSVLGEVARAGALHPSRIHQVERSVLARALLESAFQDARSIGAPTERELEAVGKEHWFDVNRPEAAQTTHFVVLQRAGQDARRAEALARALAEAVRASTNPRNFKRIVDSFPKHGFEVAVESLPPITRDGRSLRIDPNGNVIGAGPTFDAEFAHAANLLEAPGEQSGLVRTVFGFHVILLERKIPSLRVTIEAIKERYSSEIYLHRARAAVESTIQESRRTNAVTVESSFQKRIAQLQVVQ